MAEDLGIKVGGGIRDYEPSILVFTKVGIRKLCRMTAPAALFFAGVSAVVITACNLFSDKDDDYEERNNNNRRNNNNNNRNRRNRP